MFWHATFGVLFVVTLYLTVMDDRGLRLAGAACVAGIGIAYAVWGQGLQLQDRRLGTIYLAVAWPLFLLLIALTPEGDYYFVSFALFPRPGRCSRAAPCGSPWRSSSRSAWCASPPCPRAPAR